MLYLKGFQIEMRVPRGSRGGGDTYPGVLTSSFLREEVVVRSNYVDGFIVFFEVNIIVWMLL
jgi:hypothetical protein